VKPDAGNRTGREAKKRRARHERRWADRRRAVLAVYPGATVMSDDGKLMRILLPGRADNIRMTIGLAHPAKPPAS
jgi:hypothetical protein